MATPHVAGVGALLLAEDPNLTDKKVKEIILNSVDEIDALKGITVTGGRLNAHEALLLAKGDPGEDPLEIIENNGKASFAKHKEDGSYWAINNKTQEKLQLTNKKNELITDEDSDEWDGVAVELKTKKGKDSYELLLDGDGDYEDNAVVWKANDEGVIKKQKLKWVTKEKKIFKLEEKFEYDINGDDIIGKPKKDENDLNDDYQIVGVSQGAIDVLEEFNESDSRLSASFDGVTRDFSLGIGASDFSLGIAAEGISMSDSLMPVLEPTTSQFF